MQWSYDLCGAEPIYRDVPVYDATTLDMGELLMLGTTDPDSNADQGIAFITAAVASASEAVDALGVLWEKTYQTGGTAPSRTPVNTSGVYYGKAVINPFAVYECEYSQAAADDVAITTGAATTTLTITSLEDDIDAGWVYSPLAAGASTIFKLRAIATAASGSCVMDSAWTSTTSDTIIKILPVNHRLTKLNAAATKLASAAAAGDGISLHIIENFIQSDGHVKEPLRWSKHAGLNGLSNPKFYAAIALIDHVYNPNA